MLPMNVETLRRWLAVFYSQ